MRLLIERSPHGWRCHVLDMDVYGAEGVSVWNAIELAADAIEAATHRGSAPDEAREAFEAAMGRRPLWHTEVRERALAYMGRRFVNPLRCASCRHPTRYMQAAQGVMIPACRRGQCGPRIVEAMKPDYEWLRDAALEVAG